MDSSKHSHLFVFSGGNKAGMQNMDKSKQQNVIYEMSKNSTFFKHALAQDEVTQVKTKLMRSCISTLNSNTIERLKCQVNHDLEIIHMKRDTTKVCVVLDMDMFYAAVEIRDNISLCDKPVAVGGTSMICTSNYIARAFGVRAAMPGFIAKRLCPELVFVAPNFVKYEMASRQVADIIKEYDSDFRSMSLDEFFFDLTNECHKRLQIHPNLKEMVSSDKNDEMLYDEGNNNETDEFISSLSRIWSVAEDVVKEIRFRIKEQTKGLTASAGIGTSFMLAKIAADINKPDGQFQVPVNFADMTEFIDKLPTRKIPGIGKVTEKILLELGGIATVGDIRTSLPILKHVLSPAQYRLCSYACSGVDCRGEEDGDTSERKSVGVSRTFSPTALTVDLTRKLAEICSILNQEMEEKKVHARTVTLKIKLATFETLTRATTLSKVVKCGQEVYPVAEELMNRHLPTSAAVRLLGVTLTSLVFLEDLSSARVTTGLMDCFLKRQSTSSDSSHVIPSECQDKASVQVSTNMAETARVATSKMVHECPKCHVTLSGRFNIYSMHYLFCKTRQNTNIVDSSHNKVILSPTSLNRADTNQQQQMRPVKRLKNTIIDSNQTNIETFFH